MIRITIEVNNSKVTLETGTLADFIKLGRHTHPFVTYINFEKLIELEKGEVKK